MLQKWFSLVFVSLTVSYKMFSSVKRKKLSCSDQSNLVIKSKDAEIVKEVVWSLISLVLDFACGNVLRKQSEVCMFETLSLWEIFQHSVWILIRKMGECRWWYGAQCTHPRFMRPIYSSRLQGSHFHFSTQRSRNLEHWSTFLTN